MSKEIKGPITLTVADIYLRFPEIMEEEYKELLEYIDDSHLVFERCTSNILDLKKKNEQLNQRIKELENVITTNDFGLVSPSIKEYEVQILKSRVHKAIEYIETTTSKNDELNCTRLLSVNQTKELLEILKGNE